jgi:3-methyladenine DNA glycosylase AlkD
LELLPENRFDMATERLLILEKQLIENKDYLHPRDLPGEFITQVITLPDEEAMELAKQFFMKREWCYIWIAVVIFQKHPTARTRINWDYLEPLGNRMDSWGMVDAFAELAGPAWRSGQISDEQVMSWTRSENQWWRRAALVCTVFLNRKARGGKGDTPRTLAVCEVLAGDRDDMVVKGMSWALRDLCKRDRAAVEKFLEKYEGELHPRIKREVRNKLTTGVKNPGRKRT